MADAKHRSDDWIFRDLVALWRDRPSPQNREIVFGWLDSYVKRFIRRRFSELDRSDRDDAAQYCMLIFCQRFDDIVESYRTSDDELPYLNTIVLNAMLDWRKSKSSESPSIESWYQYRALHPDRNPLEPPVVAAARDDRRFYVRLVLMSIATFRFPRYRQLYREMAKHWLRTFEERVPRAPLVIQQSATYHLRRVVDSFRHALTWRSFVDG